MSRARIVRRIVLALLALGALVGLAVSYHASQSDQPVGPRATSVNSTSAATGASSLGGGSERIFAMHAAPARVTLFDGRDVAVWAYAGQVPGPTLRVRLGDTVIVPFVNDLPQDTTIHWHGVRLDNAMDGVPGVTQPPIRPGESFTYRFTPKDAGTFWYHPHVHGTEQVDRGLYGVLVVEDRDPLPYTQDVVWVLDDWRVDQNGVVDPHFDTKHDIVHDGRWGNVVTVNGRTDAVLVAHAGERIRLRLVNTANGRVMAPDFAGLDAKIIAVDGNYTDSPLSGAPFELAPGNRIDVDITIAAAQRGQRFDVVDRFGGHHHDDDPRPLASIVVLDDVVDTPAFAAPSATSIELPGTAMSAVPDVTYVLRLSSHMGGMGPGMGMGMGMGMGIGGGPTKGSGPKWLINGRAFPDFEPTTLAKGAWTKLRFVNSSGRLHPMHLHGQFFRVVARDGASAAEPFWRDTVLVHPHETVDVVLRPVDQGAWMLHCHVLEHAEAGMMTEVDVIETIKK